MPPRVATRLARALSSSQRRLTGDRGDGFTCGSTPVSVVDSTGGSQLAPGMRGMSKESKAPSVLVVDDSAKVRRVVEFVLTGAGYRVTCLERPGALSEQSSWYAATPRQPGGETRISLPGADSARLRGRRTNPPRNHRHGRHRHIRSRVRPVPTCVSKSGHSRPDRSTDSTGPGWRRPANGQFFAV